ncbi:hypothetical protein GRJ2_000235800 [Grus japonensis]|uniref:ribonuclease H n=1 Tax=Grus japonensis TaxID=30415 RepID=A0ABC9VY20_GRUJA
MNTMTKIRDNQVYWTVWIRWPGTSDPQEYKALVGTAAQCTLTPSSHEGAEPTCISGVTGGSQQLTVLLEAKVSLTGNEWQKPRIVTGPEAPCIPTTMVHRRQYNTNRDSPIPIHKLICQLESQGVISRTRSPFNTPLWPVQNGEWRLTVDYRGLNEVMPPLSAAVPDMLELQYKLESKAAKRYATIDIVNAFFSIPSVAECKPQFAFTWRGIQYTWNQLLQECKHSPTICHGLIQTALEQGKALGHLRYIDGIIIWGKTAVVSEKGKKIVQILLKSEFAI